MTRTLLLAAAFALVSCNSEATPEQANAQAAPAAGARAVKVEEKSDLLEFSYSWPAEAAALPGLNKQLDEEMGRDRVEVQAAAKEDKAGRGDGGADFFAHSYSKEWRVAGKTPRLLSIVAEVGTFTGGAHPNSDYDAIIWDREADRQVAFGDLFTDEARVMAALTGRFCKGLDAERTDKRGEALPASPGDFMTACPSLADQTMVAADSNGNGRFDTLQVLLPPSVAGPYAEAGYQVDIKIDAATLAAIKPEYRASFEGSR
ncbi:MAG TPA: DUF4163 domain-containing protein [Allosphingosinicella sp.]